VTNDLRDAASATARTAHLLLAVAVYGSLATNVIALPLVGAAATSNTAALALRVSQLLFGLFVVAGWIASVWHYRIHRSDMTWPSERFITLVLMCPWGGMLLWYFYVAPRLPDGVRHAR